MISRIVKLLFISSAFLLVFSCSKGNVGDLVLSDGSIVSSSSYDAAKNAIGVVAFKKSGIPYILGAVQGEEAPWTIKGTFGYSVGFKTSDSSGINNWKVITTADSDAQLNEKDNYPAFYYANHYAELNNLETYKEDWYLPSLEEMELIYKNRAKIDASLAKISGADLLENRKYWTSSQSTFCDYAARYVDFKTGELERYVKKANEGVIAIHPLGEVFSAADCCEETDSAREECQAHMN